MWRSFVLIGADIRHCAAVLELALAARVVLGLLWPTCEHWCSLLCLSLLRHSIRNPDFMAWIGIFCSCGALYSETVSPWFPHPPCGPFDLKFSFFAPFSSLYNYLHAVEYLCIPSSRGPFLVDEVWITLITHFGQVYLAFVLLVLDAPHWFTLPRALPPRLFGPPALFVLWQSVLLLPRWALLRALDLVVAMAKHAGGHGGGSLRPWWTIATNIPSRTLSILARSNLSAYIR